MPEKWVCLTFDDGPSNNTTHILDLLKFYNCRATFYVVGNRISSYASTIQRCAAEGNEIGIHTWEHAKLTVLSPEEIASQLTLTEQAVEQYAGVTCASVRPTGGACNDTVKTVAGQLGYYLVNWSVDTEDWKYRDADHVKKVIVEQAQDGDVVLMHDLYETSVRGALAAIDELQSRTDKTYAFVTVSQLAAIHGITLEPGVVYNGLTDEVAQQIADGSYSPTEFT